MKKSASASGFKMTVNHEELGGKPVEPGIYEARINSELTTSANGKPMAKVTYTLSGTNPSGKSVAGRKVIENIVFSNETLWKVNQPYKAIMGEDIPEGDFTVDELYGLFKETTENKRVSIEVIIEPYQDKDGNDKESNRIKKIL